MSDFNSSLPIRTQNAGDAIVKVADATTPSQQLAVDSSGRVTTKTTDGSGTGITSTGAALDVNLKTSSITLNVSDTALELAQASTTSGQKGILAQAAVTTAAPSYSNNQTDPLSLTVGGGLRADLASAVGTTLLVNTGATGAGSPRVTVAVDAATVAGSASLPSGSNLIGKAGIDQTTPGTTNAVSLAQVGATTLLVNTGATGAGSPRVTVAVDSATVAGSATLPSGSNLVGKVGIDQTTPGTTNAISVAQIGATTVLTGNGATGAGSQRVTISNDNTAIAIKLNDSTGSAFSNANPLPVTVTATEPGTQVNNYNTAAAIAAAATSNHTYTITSSKTFTLKKVWAAASGKMKIEVQTSPDGAAFTSFWVGFNSTANPCISIDLGLITIATSGVSSAIRVIRTNLDTAAQDVYSTISGTEN